MNRYKSVSTFINTSALAMAVTIGNFVRQWLSTYDMPSWVVFVFSFAVLAIILPWFQTWLCQLLGAVPRLRKLLLGRQYVEGSWIDVVRFNDGRELFGIVRIEPDGNSLRYGGENYDRKANYCGNFASKMIEADFPVISFKYLDNPSMRETYSEGIAVLTFEEQDAARPVRYTGACVDYYHAEAEAIEAWKIETRGDLQRLADPSQRKAVVLSLIETFFPEATGSRAPKA
jgi:hypothetical protein